MRERVISVGQINPLFGIICEPEATANSPENSPENGPENSPENVAVVLLNSGVIHRVGSCRLSVTLARSIAEHAGLVAVRFDFSGVGDSEARRSTLTAAESAVGEVQEVMDYLAREKKIDRFILYGLCSGAYASYRTALKDPRVIGVAQIDGYCYMSWKSYLHHYVPRVCSTERWVGLAQRILGIKKAKSGAAVSNVEARFFEVPNFGNFPPKAEVSAGLASLIKRGVEFFNVFCSSEYYNYENQYLDCFNQIPFANKLSLLYLVNTSHIVAEPEEQQKVVRGITLWAKALARKPL